MLVELGGFMGDSRNTGFGNDMSEDAPGRFDDSDLPGKTGGQPAKADRQADKLKNTDGADKPPAKPDKESNGADKSEAKPEKTADEAAKQTVKVDLEPNEVVKEQVKAAKQPEGADVKVDSQGK
jgi:hypothetical protein